MITDRPQTICALCGLTCHDQACPESNRRDCFREHARECETCISASANLPGVGMVTHLFWECRCEEVYIRPYYQPDCSA